MIPGHRRIGCAVAERRLLDQATEPMPITVTLPEFVRVSGLSKSTAYRLLKRKELQSVQIAGRRLIVMASYVELVNRHLNGGMNGGAN